MEYGGQCVTIDRYLWCDRDWDEVDVKVVCSQLEYDGQACKCGSREVQFYSIPQTRIPRPLPGLRNGVRDAGCGMLALRIPHPASRIPHTFLSKLIYILHVMAHINVKQETRVLL